MAPKRLSIVCPGRVGTAIGVLARRAGHEVVSVAGRDEGRARAAASRMGPEVAAFSIDAFETDAEVVIVAASDDAIEPVTVQLVRNGALDHKPTLVHCSGALPSEVFRNAGALACPVASMHPLQTFPSVDTALTKMAGTYFFCEGDATALPVVAELARDLGGIFTPLSREAKTLYHAAAVVACNYLSALMDASLALAEAAGIDRETGWAALRPLVRATLDNIDHAGPVAALTGPIARGDVRTIARHLEALSPGSPAEAIYRALGAWTVEMTAQKGSAAPADLKAIRALLDERD